MFVCVCVYVYIYIYIYIYLYIYICLCVFVCVCVYIYIYIYIYIERERERERELLQRNTAVFVTMRKTTNFLSFPHLSTNIQNDISQYQRYTYPRCQVAMMSKFCTVYLNICGPSVRILLHGTILVPVNLSCLLDFLKLCATLVSTVLNETNTLVFRNWF